MHIEPSGQSHGATVHDLDLSKPLSVDLIAELREQWLVYGVLAFPNQSLDDDGLERYTEHFGGFGDDPFIAPIPGRTHVIAVERRADEKASLFAENWHTDWSFQERPPAGTCLYSLVVPPTGGDTLFVNQTLALEAMPDTLRRKLEGRQAIHSARGAYAPDGTYGDEDQASGRSMRIRPSSDAGATFNHPLICEHPETGRQHLYGCIGYIVGIEGMDQQEALGLLHELHEWQTGEAFVYRHQWAANTLLMWDNRVELHRATGGYEGFDRLLHRTTIAAWAA
ncbi:MAG: TauD/TfdA dioxygenase family protein [Pseudomonadales bacterium]